MWEDPSDFGAIVIYPSVVRIVSKSLLNRVNGTVDIGLRHKRDLQRHRWKYN